MSKKIQPVYRTSEDARHAAPMQAEKAVSLLCALAPTFGPGKRSLNRTLSYVGSVDRVDYKRNIMRTRVHQTDVIELPELAERLQRLTEQGQLLQARVQEMEHQRLDRPAKLCLLEGVDAFCTSIRDAMVASSFEVQQKVLQLGVQRIVVEDRRIIIEHIVYIYMILLKH